MTATAPIPAVPTTRDTRTTAEVAEDIMIRLAPPFEIEMRRRAHEVATAGGCSNAVLEKILALPVLSLEAARR